MKIYLILVFLSFFVTVTISKKCTKPVSDFTSVTDAWTYFEQTYLPTIECAFKDDPTIPNKINEILACPEFKAALKKFLQSDNFCQIRAFIKKVSPALKSELDDWLNGYISGVTSACKNCVLKVRPCGDCTCSSSHDGFKKLIKRLRQCFVIHPAEELFEECHDKIKDIDKKLWFILHDINGAHCTCQFLNTYGNGSLPLIQSISGFLATDFSQCNIYPAFETSCEAVLNSWKEILIKIKWNDIQFWFKCQFARIPEVEKLLDKFNVCGFKDLLKNAGYSKEYEAIFRILYEKGFCLLPMADSCFGSTDTQPTTF